MGADDSSDDELGAEMDNLQFTEASGSNNEQCPARSTQSQNNQSATIDGNDSRLPRQMLVDPLIADNNEVIDVETSDDHREIPNVNISEHGPSLETQEQRRMPVPLSPFVTSVTPYGNNSHSRRRLTTGSPSPLGSSDNVMDDVNNSRIRQRLSTGTRPSLDVSDSSASNTASDYGS